MAVSLDSRAHLEKHMSVFESKKDKTTSKVESLFGRIFKAIGDFFKKILHLSKETSGTLTQEKSKKTDMFKAEPVAEYEVEAIFFSA